MIGRRSSHVIKWHGALGLAEGYVTRLMMAYRLHEGAELTTRRAVFYFFFATFEETMSWCRTHGQRRYQGAN